MSDTAKQAEAAASVNTQDDVYHPLDVAGPSTAHHGTSHTFKHVQWGPPIMEEEEPVGAAEVMCDLLEYSEERQKTEEETEIEEEQDTTEEEEEEEIILLGEFVKKCFVYLNVIHVNYISCIHMLTGAVPYAKRKPARKSLKPLYQREAETEMRNALEKAEEEDRKSFNMTPETQDKRSQLIRIRESVESMKRERAIAKKERENDAEIIEEEKEKKRKANEKTYLHISLAQKAKIDELSTKLNWQEVKQEGKLKRINSKEDKKLNLEQKMKLKSLKQSAKKLESKIVHTRAEISRRYATIERLTALMEKCKTNPNPMEENPAFTDFELASIPVKKYWKVKDGQKQAAHGSNHRSAPPPTPAIPEVDDLVRPFNEQPENQLQDEVSEPLKRPLSRRLAKRFNPKTLVARLQHHLGEKSQNSRPLGAHPGRLRSVTENMQEIVPYEVQHYDSDPEDGVTGTDLPLAEHGQKMSGRQHSRVLERAFEQEERQMHVQNGSQARSKKRVSWSSKVAEGDRLPEADTQTSRQSQWGESSGYSAEDQVNDTDLLEMYDTPTVQSKTRRSQRREENKPDTAAEADKLFKGVPRFDGTGAHSTEPSDRELLAMFESPRKPLTKRRKSQQRAEESSQKRLIDVESEVDELLKGETEWEESSVSSTPHQLPYDEYLLAKFESPRKSMSTGQRRQLEAVGRYIVNANRSSSPPENQSLHEWSSLKQKENPRIAPTSRQPLSPCDIETLIDRLLDGEIGIEEFWATPLSQERLPSPKKPMTMGQRRRAEAVKRYFENERCRNLAMHTQGSC